MGIRWVPQSFRHLNRPNHLIHRPSCPFPLKALTKGNPSPYTNMNEINEALKRCVRGMYPALLRNAHDPMGHPRIPPWREKSPLPPFGKGGLGGFESHFLTSAHPETPSPLAGEGWGEGEQNRTFQYSEALSPSPYPPPRGGGENWAFRMETN